MKMLSIGLPSTLGSYLKFCDAFYGEDSVQSKFIQQEIDSHENGADEEVFFTEFQMLDLLENM
jgi:hypothetical protein